jgi:hypothetical protein
MARSIRQSQKNAAVQANAVMHQRLARIITASGIVPSAPLCMGEFRHLHTDVEGGGGCEQKPERNREKRLPM